jgi:hypothetical protein
LAAIGDLVTTMRAAWPVAFVAALITSACVPGGPIYFGPPVVTLSGTVESFEDRTPLAQTEVCVFGTDTLCVATDGSGHYRAAFEPTMLLEGGVLDLRFRKSGYPTAMLHLTDLTTGKWDDTHCAISSRVTLSRQPVECRPLQD